MPRPKKESVSLSCKIRKDIYDKLDLYSEHSMIPKTALVERALEEYLARQEPYMTRYNYINKQ